MTSLVVDDMVLVMVVGGTAVEDEGETVTVGLVVPEFTFSPMVVLTSLQATAEDVTKSSLSSSSVMAVLATDTTECDKVLVDGT